jgi:hypothetical protein
VERGGGGLPHLLVSAFKNKSRYALQQKQKKNGKQETAYNNKNNNNKSIFI